MFVSNPPPLVHVHVLLLLGGCSPPSPEGSTSVDTMSSLYFGHLVEKKDDKVSMGVLKQFDTP